MSQPLELEVVGFCVGSPLGSACPSYLVRGGGTTLLLDCGPGTLERLWRRGVLGELEAIVLSHLHQDHMLDLIPLGNQVTELARGGGRRLTVHVPGPDGRQRLAAVAAAISGDPDRFEAAFDLREHGATERVRIGALELRFAPTDHPGGCLAVRVEDGAASLLYGGDGRASGPLAALAADADLAILEATAVEPGPLLERTGHMTGEQAADLALSAGVRRLVLTHLSPWAEGQDEENRRRAAARFPGPVDLASEGLVVRAGR